MSDGIKKYKHIIFIHLPYDKVGGLPIADKRNEIVLSHFTEKLDTYAINRFQLLGKSSITRYFLFLKAILGFKVSTKLLTETIGEISKDSLVFISHSTSGLISAMLKELYPDIKIITFFHNIESSYAWDSFKHSGRFTDLRTLFIAYYTERWSLKYSDKILVLNDRDKQLLSKTYHSHNNTHFLPISIKDRFNPSLKKAIDTTRRLKLLFVGTYFPSNKNGIMWLAKYIAPHVDADFYIVGSGMDKMKKKMAHLKNIFITGKVSQEELDHFYYNSDVFISTLFFGGGMKTKIAEAMMFGLPIIGTNESFHGYECVQDKVGIRSDHAEEIISFINQINEDRSLLEVYSENAREVYLNEYSYQSSFEKMKKIME